MSTGMVLRCRERRVRHLFQETRREDLPIFEYYYDHGIHCKDGRTTVRLGVASGNLSLPPPFLSLSSLAHCNAIIAFLFLAWALHVLGCFLFLFLST